MGKMGSHDTEMPTMSGQPEGGGDQVIQVSQGHLGRLHGRHDAKSWVFKDEEQFANSQMNRGQEGEPGEREQLAQMSQPGEHSWVWLKHKLDQQGEVGAKKEAGAVSHGFCEFLLTSPVLQQIEW